MSVPRNAILASLALAALGAPAQAQPKDPKKFQEEARPIMLPDEEKQWKSLKDKGDKEEFQKIFWARRDPDLDTPANEYRDQYEKARADAAQRFSGAGVGSDCGRVFLLLGMPDEVHAGPDQRTKVEGGPRMVREIQVWTYKDRPGMKFGETGQVQITFDDSCTLPQGARLGEQLSRVAGNTIAHPNIDYRKGPDGKLLKLEDQLPKPTPLLALLKSPREDFPAPHEQNMVLRTPDGATYIAGLVKVDMAALGADPKAAKVAVGVQAVTDTGKVVASTERELAPHAGSDGSTVVSYGLALKPGDYTLRVGVLDPKSGKGSAHAAPLKVPDFGLEEVALSPLMVLRDVQEGPTDPQHGLAAFQLGNMRLVPQYANVFTATDSVVLLGFIYGGKVDEATGKPSLTASFSILRDGAPVARAPEQAYDATPTGPSVGPVALATYKPGKYVALMTVKDNVSKKDYKVETGFEVK
jgi:GWxTD domain-containing protein